MSKSKKMANVFAYLICFTGTVPMDCRLWREERFHYCENKCQHRVRKSLAKKEENVFRSRRQRTMLTSEHIVKEHMLL